MMGRPAPAPSPRRVFVVDDDASLRESTCQLMTHAGYAPVAFASATDFLLSGLGGGPGCLILDLCMPGLSGLDVLEILRGCGAELSVIIVTGYGDVETAVRATKAGAIDFLQKPYRSRELIDAVAAGFDRLAAPRDDSAVEEARKRVAQLNSHEAAILRGLMTGQSNATMAERWRVSVDIVELQRASMMATLQAKSLSQALRLAFTAGFPAAKAGYGLAATGVF